MTIHFKKMKSNEEINSFWKERQAYEERDIFPTLSPEDIRWFKSTEYYDIIMALHHSPVEKGCELQFIWIYDEAKYLGFVMYKHYFNEDGKTMIFDYCLEPNLRNQGIGTLVFQALENYLKEEGSSYLELNSGDEGEADSRFWVRQGFIPIARDDYGVMTYRKS